MQPAPRGTEPSYDGNEGGSAVILLDDSMEEPMSDPQADPQTHLDTDPVNNPAPNPETDLAGNPRAGEPDEVDDPAHDAGEDEGWESEGGATPEGPATDT